MCNIKEYAKSYKNIKTDNDITFVVNGLYERTIDPEDLELIRFMIGGIEAK
ncbi:MAG: hypothetical protein JW705_07455 [Methanosarcinaceae archaeon]|nr:hypothetical protein [Methanosarcinaceae archaeon]